MYKYYHKKEDAVDMLYALFPQMSRCFVEDMEDGGAGAFVEKTLPRVGDAAEIMMDDTIRGKVIAIQSAENGTEEIVFRTKRGYSAFSLNPHSMWRVTKRNASDLKLPSECLMFKCREECLNLDMNDIKVLRAFTDSGFRIFHYYAHGWYVGIEDGRSSAYEDDKAPEAFTLLYDALGLKWHIQSHPDYQKKVEILTDCFSMMTNTYKFEFPPKYGDKGEEIKKSFYLRAELYYYLAVSELCMEGLTFMKGGVVYQDGHHVLYAKILYYGQPIFGFRENESADGPQVLFFVLDGTEKCNVMEMSPKDAVPVDYRSKEGYAVEECRIPKTKKGRYYYSLKDGRNFLDACGLPTMYGSAMSATAWIARNRLAELKL